MRLSEGYADLTRYSKFNPVWNHFETILAKVYSSWDITETPETDRDLYLATGRPSIAQFPSEFQADVARLREKKFAVGDNEKELMDYLVLDQREAPLFVVGGLGVGKSTTLNHFFNILLPRTRVGEESITVYVNFNKYEAELLSETLDLKEVLSKRLAFVIGPYHRQKNLLRSFWKFAAERIECFAVLADYIATFEATVDDESETQKFAAEIRSEFIRRHPLQYWYANLLFLHIVYKKNIQIVVDNIDVLPIQLQLEAVSLAYSFAVLDLDLYKLAQEEQESLIATGLKCIVALRPPARSNIIRSHRARVELFTTYSPPSVNDAVEMRTQYVMAQPETQNLLGNLKYSALEHEGKKYLHSDVEKTLNCLHRTLLLERTKNVLNVLSNGNLRVAIAFAGRFLCSHVIPDKFIAPALFNLYISKELPEHIFMRAVILAEKPLYREQDGGEVAKILNMFDAPLTVAVQDNTTALFAGYRTLCFLVSQTEDGSVLPIQALDGILELYPDLDLTQLLKNWIQLGIARSPEVCLAMHFDRFCKRIGIALAGAYYHTTLSHSFSYLQCVKDDCEIGNCDIAPLPNTFKRADQTAEAVLDFCEWLKLKEEKDITRLGGSSKRVRFNFIHYCESRPCVSHFILTRLQDELTRIAETDKQVLDQVERCRTLVADTEVLRKKIHEMFWHVKPK